MEQHIDGVSPRRLSLFVISRSDTKDPQTEELSIDICVEMSSRIVFFKYRFFFGGQERMNDER